MSLEIISRLTPEEYKLCMFVMGWLGMTSAKELGLILTGTRSRFTKTQPGDVIVIRQIARNRRIFKLG